MAKTTTPRLSLTLWGSGTDSFQRTDMNGDNADLENKVMLYAQGTLAERPAAGVSGRIYTIVGDTANNGKQFYDNGSTWRSSTADVLIESTATGNIPATIKAYTGQTADLIRAVDSNGSGYFFRLTNDGAITNQQTTPTSPGVYFGRGSGHDGAAIINSVAANKPVMVIKGASGQVNNPLVVQDNAGATLFSVTPTGAAAFAGTLSVPSALVSGNAQAASITSTASAALKNATVSPVSPGDVPLIVAALENQTVNLLETRDSSGTRLFRVGPSGSISTNTRLVMGNNAAGSNSVYDGNTPALLVYGTAVNPTIPVARLVAGAGQTSNLFEILTSGGLLRYAVDHSGNSLQEGNSSSTTAYIGAVGVTPSQFAGIDGPVTPRLEVLTGSGTEGYEDAVVLRHTGTSGNAVSRRIGVMFKQADEATDPINALSGGLYLYSNAASSASPSLILSLAGVEKFRVSSDSVVVPSTSTISMGSNTTVPKINLYGTSYQMGVQSSTMYFRTNTGSGRFAFYAGGVHESSATPGTGGVQVGLLTAGSDNRFTVGRLTLTDNVAANSTTPTVLVGNASGTHLNIAQDAISTFDNSANSSAANLFLNYHGSGGAIILGNSGTQVRLDSRTLWTGANRVYFGNGTWAAQGGAPIQNDWWFDYTNNQIKVRNDLSQWKVVGDDNWAPA
jgi:hypothetical protein